MEKVNKELYNLIYNRFLQPFSTKHIGNIGLEVEMPLVNLAQAPVDITVAKGLMDFLLTRGFKVADTTLDGEPAFIECDGDVLSFDNSYNNFEFSMRHGSNLTRIARRFYHYYGLVQSYLKRNSHTLVCMGINPCRKHIQPARVNYPVYNMVNSFLHSYRAEDTHNYPNFPAIISSTQTHLDLHLGELPEVFTLFCSLDFVRGLLFSNSPYLSGGTESKQKSVLCVRDYLWEKSAFGVTGNVGQFDEEFEDEAALVRAFANRTMFNRIRDGKYETFTPVKLSDYFTNPEYVALPEDIKTFLSFRNNEITYRGTLETRSDCTQPLADIFAPSAFALGVLYNSMRVSSALYGFLEANGIKESNSQLRKLAVSGHLPPHTDKQMLSAFLIQIITLAEDGLKSRQMGEEVYLQTLYDRAEKLTCPAFETLQSIKSGRTLEEIIREKECGWTV